MSNPQDEYAVSPYVELNCASIKTSILLASQIGLARF